MTRKESILAFAGFSAYLSERAKISAQNVIDRFDWLEIFTNRENVGRDLSDALFVLVLPLAHEALLRAESYAVELGLAGLSHEVLAAILDDVVGEAEAGLQNAIESELGVLEERVDRSLADGVSEDTIVKNLESDSGRKAMLAGVAAVLTAYAIGAVSEVERQVVETATRLQDAAAAAGGQASTPLRWQTVNDGRSCSNILEDSCEPRHGLIKPLADWTELGMPGAANLLCSIFSRSGFSRCRCLLGSPAGIDEPINASIAIMSGKNRAIAEAS